MPCGQALPTKGRLQALGLVLSFFYALAHPRRGLGGLGRIKPKAYFNLFKFIYKQSLKAINRSLEFMQFILASASPARRQLLQSIGINPFVRPSNFDESQVSAADPDSLVRTLALCKAKAVADSLDRSEYPAVVLGCDSILAIHGEIHGKPANPEEAIARWQQMRGQIGKLYTGHALIGLGESVKTVVQRQITEVYFAKPSDRQIAAYVATGEPMNCAGGFALEGKGSVFIEKLDGCYSNVIGLSLPLLRHMLEEFDLDITSFW